MLSRSMIATASSPIRNRRWPTPRTGPPSASRQSVSRPRRSSSVIGIARRHRSPEYRPRRPVRLATDIDARRHSRSRGRFGAWNSSVCTRSVGIQKYLPVVVSTSKKPAQQIVRVAQIVERRPRHDAPARGVARPRPPRLAARASVRSPARSATRAASCSRCASVGSPRNSGTLPSRNSCRRAMSARSSWRNSATTIAVVRVDRRCGVEHDVGTFQIAGESSSSAKQNAGIQIGRRLAHRCLSPPRPRRASLPARSSAPRSDRFRSCVAHA